MLNKNLLLLNSTINYYGDKFGYTFYTDEDEEILSRKSDPITRYSHSLMRNVIKSESRLFNGVDQYLSHDPIINIGTQDFFIDCFVWLDSVATYNVIYTSRASSNETGITLYIGDNYLTKVVVGRITQATTYQSIGTTPLVTKRWYYLHCEFDRDDSLNVYLDDDSQPVLIGSIAVWSTLEANQSAAAPRIGAGLLGGYMSGRVAFFGLGVGTLLTDNERILLRNNGKGLRTAQMSSELANKFVCRWDLNGNSLQDAIGTRTLTVGNGARVTQGPKQKAIVYADEYGFDEDPTDHTRCAQRAINSHASTVVFRNMGTPWIVKPLRFNASNQTVIFQPGCEVIAKTSGFPNETDCLFLANAKSNLRIVGTGATWTMLKDEYLSGESRCALKLTGCTNITVDGLTMKDSGGDGVYIGGVTACENITLKNLTLDNHYRNGISIINVNRLLIEDVNITNTNGTSPEAGVDIEPDSATYKLKNVVLRRVTTSASNRAGFNVELINLTSSSDDISILFDNCISSGDCLDGPITSKGSFAVQLNNASPVGGTIDLVDCVSEDCVVHGLMLRAKPVGGAIVTVTNMLIDNPAASYETREPISLSTYNTSINDNAGWILDGVTILDTFDRPPMSWYAESSGMVIGDITGTVTVTYDGITTVYPLTTEQLQIWIPDYTTEPTPPVP